MKAEPRPLMVDCDSHVMEPPDLWLRYLEPKYRDRAIRIVEHDGVEQLLVDDQVVLSGRLAGLGGVHVEPRSKLFADESLRYRDGCPPASFEPAARARLLDDWGVDVGVLFPTIGILPMPTTDNELLSAYARAYNTWQAEFCQDISDRIAPVAVLNLRDLDAAIHELDRCIGLGFRAVFVPPEPVDGIRPGSSHFDPLWRRCAEAGLPLCLHVVVRFTGAALPFQPWHETGAGILFSFSTGAPGQIIPAITTMVVDGLFDRVPTLKVVGVEAGCGWFAYLMDRLDEKHDYFQDMTGVRLELRPSEYLRRNVWLVAEPEERTIGAMLDLAGEDRIVWGSDFPHIDSRMDASDVIRQSVAALPDTKRSAVLGGTAAELFGLANSR